MARTQTKSRSANARTKTKRPQAHPPKIPTRQRILLAAAQLFSEQGFAGTSTRDIAERVGITQPGLYRHFKTKDEILLILATEIIAPWAQRADAMKADPNNEVVRLARLVRGICEDIVQSPFPSAFLLTEPALKNPNLRPVRRLYARVEHTIDQLLEEGMARGTLRPLKPSLARHLIMSLTDLLILPTGGSTEDKVDHIVEFALRGVLGEGADTAAILETSFDEVN